jgi:hypothetical protein
VQAQDPRLTLSPDQRFFITHHTDFEGGLNRTDMRSLHALLTVVLSKVDLSHLANKVTHL